MKVPEIRLMISVIFSHRENISSTLLTGYIQYLKGFSLRPQRWGIKNIHKNIVAQCREILKNISGSKGALIAIMINQCFDQTLQKMEKEKAIFCSSDIIESCFGKYKSIVKANKIVGITDLCLCISSLLGQNDLELTKQAMSNIKTVHIKEWKEKNIGATLYQKRNTFFKKAG